MTTVAALLKKCRVEADNTKWLYWDDHSCLWIIRHQPYRAKASRVWSTHSSLRDALVALTKEDV